jgi:P27 family predicted phage terminase small subunit
MGLRGFPPKPTALKLIEGNPGHQRINKSEPRPDDLTPRIARSRYPKYLARDERRLWRYYAGLLASLRVLTEADLVGLEQMSRVTAERIRMEAILAKTGPLAKSKKTDTVYISPVWMVVQGLRDRELKLLREFGMTPSSRTRISVTGPSAADAIEDALA